MFEIIIGLDNGLSPIQRRAIIWTNALVASMCKTKGKGKRNIFT